MDHLISSLKNARKESAFKGTSQEFSNSSELILWCIINRRIVPINPSGLSKIWQDIYRTFLIILTLEAVVKNPNINNWFSFSRHPSTVKMTKIIHNFGVRNEIFGPNSFRTEKKPADAKNITIEELYELYCIRTSYKGSLPSFKRFIQNKYGSFAEFCLFKGYDINNNHWIDRDTAIRIAVKLGSANEINRRAPGLFIYLQKNNLIKDLQIE